MRAKVNGIEVAYDLAGHGPLLVLCHPLGLDRSIWFQQVPAFSRSHTVLAWDARGHGETSKPPGPYDFDLMARDLAALLDELHADQVPVLGLSMGGDVAVAFAADYPDRPAALVLADTTAWYGSGAAATWEERIETVRSSGVASLAEGQRQRWFSEEFRSAHPQVVEQVLDVLRRADAGGYIAVLQALAKLDLRDRLEEIRCPTLVLVGENDPVSPLEMAEELHRGISGSRLRIIHRAQHLTPVEQPDEFNRAVLEFLADVGA